jgi:hypothetical protein
MGSVPRFPHDSKARIVSMIPADKSERERPCALCRRQAKLCKSHIVPEFLYKDLYDKDHRLWKISTNPLTRTTRPRKGVYEHLLCPECERRTSSWDDYASKVLRGGIERKMQECYFGWFISGLNYRLFKLFQLSLLWRAAVSQRPEFQDFLLARRPKSRLRHMLLSEDPGNPLEFGCLMLVNQTHLGLTGDVVLTRADAQQRTGKCLFVMGGLFWLFFIPYVDAKTEEYRFILSESGEVTVIREEFHTERFLAGLAVDLKKSGNLPSVEIGGRESE